MSETADESELPKDPPPDKRDGHEVRADDPGVPDDPPGPDVPGAPGGTEVPDVPLNPTSEQPEGTHEVDGADPGDDETEGDPGDSAHGDSDEEEPD